MASLPHDAKPALLPLAGHPYRFLGSYRFMLALFVLTSHASGFLGDAVARLSLGNVGVFLFFMVSGAVISEALDIFYNGSGRRFLINRSLKIFPAYWAALCLYYAVFAFKGALGSDFQLWPVLVNVSLLLSYLPTGNNLLIISIAWAVVVECQFYLIAAMLYVAAWRTRTPGGYYSSAGSSRWGSISLSTIRAGTHGFTAASASRHISFLVPQSTTRSRGTMQRRHCSPSSRARFRCTPIWSTPCRHRLAGYPRRQPPTSLRCCFRPCCSWPVFCFSYGFSRGDSNGKLSGWTSVSATTHTPSI